MRHGAVPCSRQRLDTGLRGLRALLDTFANSCQKARGDRVFLRLAVGRLRLEEVLEDEELIGDFQDPGGPPTSQPVNRRPSWLAASMDLGESVVILEDVLNALHAAVRPSEPEPLPQDRRSELADDEQAGG